MASRARILTPVFLVALGSSSVACNSGGQIEDDTTSSSTGSSSSKAGSTNASSTDASSTDAATSSGSGGMGGMGGAGGAAPGWPTCDTQPPSSTSEPIPQVWSDNPAMPKKVWLPGVYVTAVARSGCVAMQSCQIFVQQSESFATLAAAQKQSLPIGIAPAVAEHFVGIKVGDKVDVYGHVFRNTQDGKNELGILVTPSLQGCAKVVGTGNPTPVAATLPELTTPYYEANGPALVTLSAVTGKTKTAVETFALWDTIAGPTGGIEEVTSLSPFFLSGAAFTNLPAGQFTDFVTVTGVFGIFAPDAVPLIKYEEIYPRTANDIVVLP